MIISPVQKVLDRLNGVKKQGTGWRALCPAHDDRRPSLDIDTGDDGRVLLICRSHRCSIEKIASALGLSERDLFPDDEDAQARTPKSRRPQKKLSAAKTPSGRTFLTENDAVADLKQRIPHDVNPEIHWYHDTDREPVGATVIFRQGKDKEVRPLSRNGDGWKVEAMPGPRPLYKLPELSPGGGSLPPGARVFVVEGEKCADAACKIGLLATTSAGGCKAAERSDWSPLVGCEVVILPDNDDAGDGYAMEVIESLEKLNPMPTVRKVELPDLPEKGDVVDYIDRCRAAGWTDEQIRDEIQRHAAAAECIKLQRPQPPVPRYRPFPVEVLPEPMRCLAVEGAAALAGSADYFVAAELATVAAAIGNALVVELKPSWREQAAVWCTIIGESGTGKSEPLRVVMKETKRRERQHVTDHKRELKEYEAEEVAYRRKMREWEKAKGEGPAPQKPDPPFCKRLWTADTTPERLSGLLAENPRGLLVISPELAGWLGNFGRYTGARGADSAMWLNLFHAEDLVSDRQSRGMTSVPRALVSIVGTIQPETFRDMIGKEHRTNGLLARLLVVHPPRRAKRWTDDRILHATEAAYAQCISRLLNLDVHVDEHGCPQPVPVPLTPDAQARFARFVDDHNAETMTLSGDLAAAWSKLEAYAARFALIFHAVRWAAGDLPPDRISKIGVEDIESAIVAVQWFGEQAKRVYGLFHENAEDRDRRALIEHIEQEGGSITIRELMHTKRQFRKSKQDAEDSLEALKEAGFGDWDYSKEPGKKGRAAKRFVLTSNPGNSGNGNTKPPRDSARGNSVTVTSVVTPENTIDAPAVAGHDEATPDTSFGAINHAQRL